MLPQMYMIYNAGDMNIVLTVYMCQMGLYRFMYLLNWVYRYRVEGFYDPIAFASGFLQTFIYVIFVVKYGKRHLMLERNSIMVQRDVEKAFFDEENSDENLILAKKDETIETPDEKMNINVLLS